MRKNLLLCGLAIAGVVYASSEKINFFKDNELLRSIRVEKIDHISYAGDNEGYHTLNINMLDGTTTTVALDEIDRIGYTSPLPASPLSIEVEPHHMCATLHITSADPTAWYRISGVHAEQLKGHDEADWADILVEDDIAYIKERAEYYGAPLSSFKMSDIFEQGTKKRDWFPSDYLTDNSPIALVAYTATIENDDVVVTTEPVLVRFTTKKIEDLGVSFNLTADMTSTTITVKADAVDSDIPFAIDLYSVEDVEQYGLQYLVGQSMSKMETLVYNYGSSWDEQTFRIHGEKTYTNLRMGDQYLAVAYGCEYGVATTDASKEYFTVPAPVITDDCTFEVNAVQLSPSEMSVEVTPSNPDTRYAAFLVESATLTDSYTPAQYLANTIYWINYKNTFQWATTDFIHTGASTLSTNDGMIGGLYLQADKEYTVLICGIDEKGERTTEIKEVACKTSVQTSEALAFDISFSDFDASSSWTHFINVNIAPSDPEAKYVMTTMAATNTYADLSVSDEEFIQRYVDVQGQYLELYTGAQSKKFAFSSSWDSAAGGYAFKKHILVVFGYDGAPTSPLYVYSIDTATGETEMLRGPEPEQGLSFGITAGDFDGSSSWTHFLTVDIAPSDPEAKYVMTTMAATNSYADLSVSDEEFIQRYVDVQGQYLELYTGAQSKKFAFSSSWDSAAGGYAFKEHILVVFGYDGAPTSPLYVYSIDTATGEMTPLRGPEAE